MFLIKMTLSPLKHYTSDKHYAVVSRRHYKSTAVLVLGLKHQLIICKNNWNRYRANRTAGVE